MAAPILWGIFLLASRFIVSKMGSTAAKELVKKGAKQVAGRGGKKTWKRESGAASNAEGLQAAQSVGGAAKAIGEGTKVAAAKSVGNAAKAIGEGIKKSAAKSAAQTARLANTPWRVLKDGKHVFKPLDNAVRNKLSSPMRKRYDKALKTYNNRVGRTTAERTMRNRGRGPLGQTYGVGRAGFQRLGSGSATSGAARVAKAGLTAGGYGWVAGMAVDAAVRQTPWFKKWREENPDAPESQAKPVGKADGPNTDGPKTDGPKTAPKKEASPIAKDRHGKYSPQAGRALGKKHGIDISYDFPGMSADDYQKGLDKGTISKKLGKTKKGGKLTERAKEELEERRLMRHGGSVSSDNYKLRKKSSKAKSAKVSKKSSWNY